ncbi:MAG: hypothetical protein R2744_02595 [Bacteroidales bacterium]
MDLINNTVADRSRVREVIARALDKKRLTLEETAVLVNTTDPDLVEEIKAGARELKKKVYGNRIVLFGSSLWVTFAATTAKYCGFRSSNKSALRKTLTR